MTTTLNELSNGLPFYAWLTSTLEGKAFRRWTYSLPSFRHCAGKFKGIGYFHGAEYCDTRRCGPLVGAVIRSNRPVPLESLVAEFRAKPKTWLTFGDGQLWTYFEGSVEAAIGIDLDRRLSKDGRHLRIRPIYLDADEAGADVHGRDAISDQPAMFTVSHVLRRWSDADQRALERIIDGKATA